MINSYCLTGLVTAEFIVNIAG